MERAGASDMDGPGRDGRGKEVGRPTHQTGERRVKGFAPRGHRLTASAVAAAPNAKI
jgi:hypothetical protein